jgi:hypothetical protein
MRWVLVFLLVLGTVFAQCSSYLSEDAGYAGYPNDFAAALKYGKTGDCYAATGDMGNARNYWYASANLYVEASKALVSGGDNRLRGLSYEYAADSYYKLGMKADADKYYSLAETQYTSAGLNVELSALEKKIASRASNITGQAYALSPLWVIPLFVVFFCIGLAILFLYWSGGTERHSVSYEPVHVARAERRAESVEERHVEPARRHVARDIPFTKPSAPAAKPEQPTRTLSPKEKMREKIRRKYLLQ